jgi:hypothetical protein
MERLTDHTPVDAAVAGLATRQHGVVALWQLRGLGLSKSGVSWRATAGRLHRAARRTGRGQQGDRRSRGARVERCGSDRRQRHSLHDCLAHIARPRRSGEQAHTREGDRSWLRSCEASISVLSRKCFRMRRVAAVGRCSVRCWRSRRNLSSPRVSSRSAFLLSVRRSEFAGRWSISGSLCKETL